MDGVRLFELRGDDMPVALSLPTQVCVTYNSPRLASVTQASRLERRSKRPQFLSGRCLPASLQPHRNLHDNLLGVSRYQL